MAPAQKVRFDVTNVTPAPSAAPSRKRGREVSFAAVDSSPAEEAILIDETQVQGVTALLKEFATSQSKKIQKEKEIASTAAPAVPRLGAVIAGEGKRGGDLVLAQQLLAVFRVLGGQRSAVPFGELYPHIAVKNQAGLTQEDVGRICALLPDVFSCYWVTMSRDERIIAKCGGSHAENGLDNTTSGCFLHVACKRIHADRTTDANALKPITKKHTGIDTSLPPLPTWAKIREDHGGDEVINDIKRQKMDLMGVVEGSRLQEEVIELRQDVKVLEERMEDTKQDVKVAGKRKADVVKVQEMKAKRSKIKDELREKKQGLQEAGERLKAKGLTVPSKSSTKSSVLLSKGVQELLPQVEKAQQRSRLKSLYSLMREWSLLAPATQRVYKQRLQAALTLQFPHDVEQREVQEIVAKWDLPVTVSLGAHLAKLRRSVLIVVYKELPSALVSDAWRLIHSYAPLAALLEDCGLVLTEVNARGLLKPIATTPATTLKKEDVTSVALELGNAMSGVMVCGAESRFLTKIFFLLENSEICEIIVTLKRVEDDLRLYLP